MLRSIAERFEFERLQTDWTTEVVAGISLFLSIAYIFILNPAILSESGIPAGAVFFATIVASASATLIMGLYARLPFALAPGLEANGFFAFVVVATLGFTWQEALGIVFWSGLLCLVLTIIPARQRIIDSIPEGLKVAISVSVGVFVMVIGLVVTDLVQFSDGVPSAVGDFASPKAFLLYIGFAVALLLGLRRKSTGRPVFFAGMLVSIVLCTVIAHFLDVKADTPPAVASEFFSALGAFDLFGIFSDPRTWTVLLVFFMIDFYGSIGKFIGLTRQTNLQTEGAVKNMDKALYVDGGATMVGSALGTSTVITYVESAVGIGQGGRTGIVAIVCALLMFASLSLSSLVSIVPTAAVAGTLIYVGWLLFPRDELFTQGGDDANKKLASFDFFVVTAMGLLSAVTFSLDKALLLGFVAYSAKALVVDRKLNPYLAGSTVLLGVAMAYQYFGLS
ncbi:NCS2 family permease [Pontixanthobacter sp. CEM42]|uniref:NCS2 family permease n=1 Tax=Pontixanthobacter sp. CEM42 TaxID=2792077 RepID=UPI001AE01B60|nr:NCS2 family permease [Pontixanthobacter sp. CEM42]